MCIRDSDVADEMAVKPLQLFRLRTALEGIQADVVLIDCPPNLGSLTYAALIAAQWLIVPVEPAGWAIDGLQRTADKLPEIQREIGHAPALLGAVATKVRLDLTAHRTGLGALNGLGVPVLAQIPRREGADARKQLEAAEGTYKDLIKARDVAVNAARAKIESLKGAINDMKMKKAMAEMNEMAAGMIGSIGGSGDTLNRLHDMVEEERNKASGRARVAKDSIDMADINLKEAEMTALADQALADFAAAEGLSLGTEATPAEASRSMGATAEKPSESQQG